MSDDNTDSEPRPLQKFEEKRVIQLGNKDIDISHLPEQDQMELMRKFAEGHIDLAKKAAELGIETQALDTRMGSMADKVSKAAESGASATVTGAYDDSMGRTEIIVGNTDAAAKGKLDRSQRGEKDQTLMYVVIAAIVIIIVAVILAK